MKLFPALPENCDQVRGFKHAEVLRHRLPAHRKPLAQFAERLAVALEQSVEQLPTGRVGERLEDEVHLSVSICK